MYKITEIANDAMPSYRIGNLPKRFNEAFLKKTKLAIEVNKDVMKALKLYWITLSPTITAYAYQFFC